MPVPISRDRVRELVAQGGELIEVLPAHEYDAEHLPGSRSVPLRHLSREAVAALGADRVVIVYCWDSL